MRYFLFLDESGDHGLITIDPSFPVFVLCGILISEEEYKVVDEKINKLKRRFWNEKKVILHSRDIRKCEKEFSILFNPDIKKAFYSSINEIIQNSNYTIIASCINKVEYLKRYGLLTSDIYSISLSFILERSVFFLDDKADSPRFYIAIEKRGGKEDKNLADYINRIRSLGTYYVNPSRLSKYKIKTYFKDKKENINGLQLADLVAYPIARHVIETTRANPAFDVLHPKIYSKNGKTYGLKIFP